MALHTNFRSFELHPIGEDSPALKLNNIITECKSMCLMHTEAKLYRNIGVWSRERFIAGPCKEMGGSCPKKPEFMVGRVT